MTPPTPILDYHSPRRNATQPQGWLAAIGMALVWMFAGAGFLLFASSCGGPVWALMAAVAITMLLRQVRRYRGLVVLGYLEQATRMNLPLSDYLLAASCSERGKTARRLLGLRQLLNAGYDVGPALAEAVPEVPERVTGRVSAGERLGQLRRSLLQVVAQERQKPMPLVDRAIFARSYPLFMITFMSWLIIGMMIYVVPKFREIF